MKFRTFFLFATAAVIACELALVVLHFSTIPSIVGYLKCFIILLNAVLAIALITISKYFKERAWVRNAFAVYAIAASLAAFILIAMYETSPFYLGNAGSHRMSVIALELVVVVEAVSLIVGCLSIKDTNIRGSFRLVAVFKLASIPLLLLAVYVFRIRGHQYSALEVLVAIPAHIVFLLLLQKLKGLEQATESWETDIASIGNN